ncbi:MAG: hypothetical protein ACKO0Z_07610 [Betaproteobacteria bacterium]
MAAIDRLRARSKSAYFTREFLREVDTFIEWLKNRPGTQSNVILVDNPTAVIYNGDLSSFLFKLGQPLAYHYPIMRVSGFMTGMEFGPGNCILYIPSESDILAVYTMINTKQGETI